MMEPWRLHAGLTVWRLEAESSMETMATWIASWLREEWSSLFGVDPIGHAGVEFGWSVDSAGNVANGAELAGDSSSSFSRLLRSFSGLDGNAVFGWTDVSAASRGIWRPPLRVSIGGYAGVETFFVLVDVGINPLPQDEDLWRAETMLISLIRSAVDAGMPLAFANVTDDNSQDITAFEKATNLNSRAGHRSVGQLARSYSWTTYLPPHLSKRLRGDGSSNSPDGIYSVEDLMGGGILIQASVHLADHVGSSVVSLRRFMDPVLDPRPTASVRPGRTSHLRVQWSDGSVGPFDHGSTREPRRLRS